MIQFKFHHSFNRRLAVTIVFVAIILVAVAARVFSLAIVEHRRFALAAERQQQIVATIPSVRGAIFAQDKTGGAQPLAIQKTFFTLVAVPKNISDAENTALALREIGIPDDGNLAAKLSKSEDPYEIIAKKLNNDVADKIRALDIKGLELVEESRRVYPLGALAANAIGFASYKDGDEKGEYGIERQLEKELKGETGFFSSAKDNKSGFLVSLGRRILNPPVNGASVVLTIDPNIQYKVEEELKNLQEKWAGDMALGIVMEPKTGKVLALGRSPSFDPNAYSKEEDFSVFGSPAVDSQFELGSVFKPITMAAAIEAGVVTASTTYNDPGAIRFGTFTVANFDGQPHGVQTMTQVLEKSLNTGAVFAEQKLGQEKFHEAVKRFGFGEKSGVDLPNEVAGNISNLDSGRAIDYATASFGQGIAVTPLQIASAMSAIANGGILMRPYIVDKIIDTNGGERQQNPEEKRRVVGRATSEIISQMLVSAVRNGFENRAGIKGYFVAGKTGTAQIPFKDRRGYSADVIHTFVGYAPAFDPKFLVLLMVEKPRGNRFAANTLTPAFHNIAEFILNYYGVPPDEN